MMIVNDIGSTELYVDDIEAAVLEAEVIESADLQVSGGRETQFDLTGRSPIYIEGTNDYNELVNKPKIESVELTGDKSFEDLGLDRITNSEIENLVSG